MNAKWRVGAALVLAGLVALKLWPWFAVGAVLAVAAEVFLLWLHPYGACGDLFHRGGGKNIGSGDEAWGNCPRCHGKPVPRRGAAAVAALVGDKYGRRYW